MSLINKQTLIAPKPKALDLFCGQGGASMGLHLAGFEVVGVDIKNQPRYPFEFHQADALSFPLKGFDLIWASPPCQFASVCTPTTHKHLHKNLIPAIRERLVRVNTPFIIENVPGAKQFLRNPIKLCGSMFGLEVWRHRYFETSHLPLILVPPCNHSALPVLVSGSPRRKRPDGTIDRTEPSVRRRRDAMKCEWMSEEGLDEAIPPTYSKFLGKKMLEIL